MFAPRGPRECLEKYTKDVCDFVATPLVRQITGGIHVNDALIYNAWDRLPQEWTSWWSSCPDYRLAQQDLIDSIDEDERPEPTCDDEHRQFLDSRPPCLTGWLGKLKSLALPRSQRPGPTAELPEILWQGMKAKKIAEVSAAMAYIQRVCQEKGITRVVDMGSGQGYLSVSLAHLVPGLRVLSIDGSESQVAGSKALAASLGIPEQKLRHLVHWIDGSSDLAAEIEDWAGGQRCMLVGLHACGSLSEHMVRYFTTVDCIESLAVVGCCYNHIVPRSPDCPTGFPISATLREHGVALSLTALMTACQAPNNWSRADMTCPAGQASIYARRRLYRAILEKIFHDKAINFSSADKERPIWGTRKGDVATFAKYARRTMDCLSVDREQISAAELLSYEERYGDCQGQVAILWTLSVICCKVVESVIAMDRFWFLREHGADKVDVLAMFDAKVSPRNLMIVADKAASGLP